MTITPLSPKLAVNADRVSLKLSTNAIPPRDRYDWLREVICREYAHVDITSPPKAELSQDLSIYPWGSLQLSTIQSSAIALERLPREPHLNSQDAYFAVMLVSGDYRLEQNGREVLLQPGDMTLYDATRPHRIQCPGAFTKLILSIPRTVLRDRIAGIDACTALRLPGDKGVGFIAANFLRASAAQADELQAHELSHLSEQALDLLTLAVTSVRPARFNLSRSRAVSLNAIKTFIEQNLRDLDLDTGRISGYAGLSARYINDLFEQEGTSLMRYVWQRRLEHCRKELLNPVYAGHRLSDIAFRWGFNDAAHFSRAFKQQFGCSPREFRRVEVQQQE
ncbi:helix-turn-helix domain-containing protein [Methylomicrobium lacus]|uniref:AraC-like ligand-binding domain-containing protein n=1 Tax=Methylomicrobium lacus TaxID=136992 RepID=UPI00045E7215|nr:helix-turn-helix domain-containing protein [Methylomicrobium lacus]